MDFKPTLCQPPKVLTASGHRLKGVVQIIPSWFPFLTTKKQFTCSRFRKNSTLLLMCSVPSLLESFSPGVSIVEALAPARAPGAVYFPGFFGARVYLSAHFESFTRVEAWKAIGSPRSTPMFSLVILTILFTNTLNYNNVNICMREGVKKW